MFGSSSCGARETVFPPVCEVPKVFRGEPESPTAMPGSRCGHVVAGQFRPLAGVHRWFHRWWSRSGGTNGEQAARTLWNRGPTHHPRLPAVRAQNLPARLAPRVTRLLPWRPKGLLRSPSPLRLGGTEGNLREGWSPSRQPPRARVERFARSSAESPSSSHAFWLPKLSFSPGAPVFRETPPINRSSSPIQRQRGDCPTRPGTLSEPHIFLRTQATRRVTLRQHSIDDLGEGR